MTLEAKISGLAYGGAFVGEVTTPGEMLGKRVFIREACPKEIVSFEVLKDHKNYIEGSLSKIITPSQNRRAPTCPVFGQCGGCDLQHINIDAQREAKRAMIETTLRLQAKLTPNKGVINASNGLPEYNYRRRVFLHFSTNGEMGFFKSGSRDVINIEHCPISSIAINNKILELKSSAKELSKKYGGVIIEEHGDKIELIYKDRELNRGAKDQDGENEATAHFSQVNAAGNLALIDLVTKNVLGKEVTDLYAGSGNFSIPLAKLGMKVDAVELDSALVKLGQAIAAKEKLEITFFQSSCEKFLKKFKLCETVVLDPPRGGAKEVVKHFRSHSVKQIVYVSCSLPTLVRDLRTLADLGYSLEEVHFVDMFPQTHHVETVSILLPCT